MLLARLFRLKELINIHSLRELSSKYEMSKTISKNCIVWLDLEMTGLDISKHHILEIGVLITDKNLNVIAEGPNLIIHQPANIINESNEWVKDNLKELLALSSQSKISVNEADSILLKFLKEHATEKTALLAGNSVYMDRMFLIKYFPCFNDYMHYRNIDVSTVKELAKSWNPEVYKNAPKKKLLHRGLDDIKESLEEMKYYKMNFFNLSQNKE